MLGSPIAHSLSPVLHRAAYDALGLTGWSYDAVEVTSDGLASFLDGCGPEWAGLSLTMPLKQTVIPLLTSVHPQAAAVGAANTVVLEPSGARVGFNTDVHGIVAALGRGVAGPAVVLGGGATAASAVAALRRLGVGSVSLAVRSAVRAAPVLSAAAALGVDLSVVPWDTAASVLGSAAVAVSTVPAGAADAFAGELPTAVHGRLLDVVYDPWPTPLAAAWAERGGAVVSGLEMLLHQAAEQVRLMTGLEPPVSAMRAALEAAVQARGGTSR